MKKTLIIAMAVMSAVSCVSREIEPSIINVRFGYEEYESGKLTKVAVDNTKEVKDMISKSLPKTFPLDLHYELKDIHFSTQVGEEVRIPVGRYTISGRNEITSTINDSKYKMSSEPQMGIYESMEISTQRNDYPLTASFKCFALVVDFKEVEKVVVDGIQIPFLRDGDYGLIYVEDMGSDFSIDVYPKDNAFNEKKSFTMSKKMVNGYVFCQEGCYYLVHPKAVETQGLSFRINYEEMQGQDVK